MTDPLSILAIGAAVGGAAGKFTEMAWHTGERWLRERFGTHAEAAQVAARENAAGFVIHLARLVKALEDMAVVAPSNMAASERQPQFSSLLQRAILAAAETDDTSKHDLLARLVADRLMVPAETVFALASPLACDAIARSTRRQIELMALRYFVDAVPPPDDFTEVEFTGWLSSILEPFAAFEFHELDARHIGATACASYDPALRQELTWVLLEKWGDNYPAATLNRVPPFQHINGQWEHGLCGIALTSVGSIVGALGLEQISVVKVDVRAFV